MPPDKNEKKKQLKTPMATSVLRDFDCNWIKVQLNIDAIQK